MNHKEWPFPGSRWWKFDFHTHTPASYDTPWYKEQQNLQPDEWLLEFMKAKIDCVAITDHNSGEWIDRLKNAYSEMKEKVEADALPGFRELVLFPGVEISVHGGIHILAIFDPEVCTGDIDSLIGKVNYRGTKGDCNSETVKSISEVIQAVLDAGGLPIPAHADMPKGLLQVHPNSRQSVIDPGTIKQAFENDSLLAIEWCDPSNPFPEIASQEAKKLAQVAGSDCHSFSGVKVPDSRYTWVKMEVPNLEGLRLALLDGNKVSIRRSDDNDAFDPLKLPGHMIKSVKISKARYMGNGEPAYVAFSPYCNTFIGGRGTGKSTIINFLRFGLQREKDLKDLDSIRQDFNSFAKIPRNKNDSGALRENTEISIEWLHDRVVNRVECRIKNGKQFEYEVQEKDEQENWQLSRSQSINPDRFPLHIFSQGQIAEMAGNGQALLDIIDEAAGIVALKKAFEDAKRTFLAQRARLREIEGKLEQMPEVDRKLQEAEQKLIALTKSHYAEVYKTYQRAQRQKREVNQTVEQLNDIVSKIEMLADELFIEDWPEGVFDKERDADILRWRNEAEKLNRDTYKAIMQMARSLRDQISAMGNNDDFASWKSRILETENAYSEIKQKLSQEGISDPQEFDQWIRQRQSLELERKELNRLIDDKESLIKDIDAQLQRILDARRAITEARGKFIQSTIQENRFVRMEIIPFGNNEINIERSFRDLIDVPDERFSEDILKIDGTISRGLVAEIASASNAERLTAISNVKNKILRKKDISGFLKNYLKDKTPEFFDYVECWYPEDDLKIEYSRDGSGTNWAAIAQGSKGQRAAALLAFLLSFGEEPIVLDQPEDDLDNHLIYDLIVSQIRENKLRRQLVIVTHNANIVVNGDAEMIYAMDFASGQCIVAGQGALQQSAVRSEVCRIMEGGRDALARRWARLGKEIPNARNTK